ncbi:MAG: hypothetical protein ACI955_000622 [Zhongshania sp.]|jgi:hypothetical protein
MNHIEFTGKKVTLLNGEVTLSVALWNSFHLFPLTYSDYWILVPIKNH